jgi:hypothetical protein
MRLGPKLALALAFAVAAPVPAEGDRPTKSSKSSKTKKTKKKTIKKKKKSTRSAKRSKKSSKAKKKQPVKVAANMPKGWSWPPTRAMIAAGADCTKQLDALGIVWEKADAPEKDAKIVTPVTIPGMEVGGLLLVSKYKKPPHTMDCHLALGLATYGPKLVALGVREIHFSSIYRNTLVRAHGVTKNVLSRHALGLAIDVRSFVDEAGREAIVETDYNAADPMLLAIEQTVNESGGFRTVLTPRNDPSSHYDHFHLEIAVEYPTEPKKPDI